MDVDHSYVGVPTTTQETMANEDYYHPVESLETDSLADIESPTAPMLSAPTVKWKSLVTPIGTLVLGAALALGHHAFNHWEDGKSVVNGVVPQHWVTRIGVGFSYGFKSAVGVTMGFVLLQCLWLTVVRQSLTIQDIDTMYRIERQDQLYKTLLKALFFSPTIVVFTALNFLLPLSGVFAPGSLTVVTQNFTDVGGSCMIPSGNLSTPNTPDSISLFSTSGGKWGGVTPRAMELTAQCLVEQRIPDLPQACGPDCRYKVSVPSFVIQCTPNPSSLPYMQVAEDPYTYYVENSNASYSPGTLWNATVDLFPISIPFYVGWHSSGPNGTSGNASCSPVQAQYDVEMKGGLQSVTTKVTQITSPFPTFGVMSNSSSHFLMQLSSLYYATRALFMGSVYIDLDGSLVDNIMGQPSFLEILPNNSSPSPLFVWGDVLKGIEEMSHNVTAALLTLQLGNISSECFYDQQTVIYQYSSFALWLPYGMALGVALISLVIAIVIMARNNTSHITTSFSDTAFMMRNVVDKDVSTGAKLRLRAVTDDKLEYTLE